MLKISNNLCRFTSRLLNIRFLSTSATKVSNNNIDGSHFNNNYLPLVNISIPFIKRNPIIVPLKLPLNYNSNQLIIETPGLKKIGYEYIDPIGRNLEIEAPSTTISDTPKYAARLIVIRRKKMKKHKLRKLRKRMKFEWGKRRQLRELRKEKAFQAGLIMQYKKAETFSAEEYVKSRLEKLNEVFALENEKALLFRKIYNMKLKK